MSAAAAASPEKDPVVLVPPRAAADVEDVVDERVQQRRLGRASDDVEAVDTDAKLYTKGIVPETDDPNAPSLSIFSFRTNSFTVSSVVAALLSYPMGLFLARVIPKGILNPGPFSIKEHVLIYIIAGAAGGQAFGIDNVIAQKFDTMLNDPAVNFGNSIIFVLSTQMLGYGLSGITRRYLVRPAAMYWPTVLPTVALFMSFHESEESEEMKKAGSLSRYSFFWLAFVMAFVWQWIPSYFAGAIGSISLLCLFSTSKTARFLGSAGNNMGVGILSITFDWTLVQYFFPLSTPWWAAVNYFVGNVVCLWIVVPILMYNHTFGGPNLKSGLLYDDGTPFPVVNTPSLFTGLDGSKINPAKFYDTVTFDINKTAYNIYKPIYLTEHFVVEYAMSFFVLTASITHVALWYYKDIIRQTKEMLAQTDEANPDIHNTLMKAYPDFPEWIYLAWLGVWCIIQMIIGLTTPFRMPWWGTPFAIIVAFIYTVPAGIIQGSTGQQIGLNVLSELIMGLIIPGQTVPVMIFKCIGYNVMYQCLTLTSDLKIGHYLHINPVHMVFAQLYGTVIGAICNTASVWIAISAFPLGTNDWLYTNHLSTYTSGGIWGAIGPARFWGPESPYFAANLSYLVGIILPFLPWLGNKVFPHPYWRFVHFPLMAYLLPSGFYHSALTSFIIISFVFMNLLFTYQHAWWAKYNFVLSAALDAGSGIAVLISTLLAIKIVVPASSVNPNVHDYYCTGRNWDDPQFS
ncbi:OPT superfamily [Polyrhizophydium stewartii]|uniref:OPT superfamily n=1 Tax=Polyrhizophydium stewartii TaxID=2732419 RepID=A0ABR4MYF0_9FUNG